MAHDTACRSLLLTVSILLVCAALGSAQSGNRRQQKPWGATVGTQVAVGSYPQQPQTPPDTVVGNDGAEMVLVPAGEFSMGSDGDELDRLQVSRKYFENEIPRHRVYLDAFYIDKYEVTNARFQRFVQTTGHRTQAERV